MRVLEGAIAEVGQTKAHSPARGLKGVGRTRSPPTQRLASAIRVSILELERQTVRQLPHLTARRSTTWPNAIEQTMDTSSSRAKYSYCQSSIPRTGAYHAKV